MRTKKFQALWQEVEPILNKAKKKDFVLHTSFVVQAMEELIKHEGGESDILIPAAILHDIGWSAVPEKLQFAEDAEGSRKALVEHIKQAGPIIQRVLKKLHYDQKHIQEIIRVVASHKSIEPQEHEKHIRLLIDADTLSDTYKEAFYSDAKAYKKTPLELWKFRSKNVFYTKTATRIFQCELQERWDEIQAE